VAGSLGHFELLGLPVQMLNLLDISHSSHQDFGLAFSEHICKHVGWKSVLDLYIFHARSFHLEVAGPHFRSGMHSEGAMGSMAFMSILCEGRRPFAMRRLEVAAVYL